MIIMVDLCALFCNHKPLIVKVMIESAAVLCELKDSKKEIDILKSICVLECQFPF